MSGANRDALLRAAQILLQNESKPVEPLRLYAPGPFVAAKWRKMFPGIEVIEAGKL